MRYLNKSTDRVIFLLKNIEINKSKSIVDSTWGVIKDFFKKSQTNKYTAIAEQIKKEKVPFEELLSKSQ